jgi:hypothetical protein
MCRYVPLEVASFLMRGSLLSAIAAVVLIGCTPASGPASTSIEDSTTTTSADLYGCVSAPESLRHSYGEFPLTIDENPVTAGDTVTIRIGSMVTYDPQQQVEAVDWGITDYGARWECWTGSEWVNTHLLAYNGETLGGDPSVSTTVPAIGRGLPDAFEVIVPDVRPGWYRIKAIADRPGQTGSDWGTGYIAVEVVN